MVLWGVRAFDPWGTPYTYFKAHSRLIGCERTVRAYRIVFSLV